jgi:hypothetical protein
MRIPRRLRYAALLAFAWVAPALAVAEPPPAVTPVLPPEIPWHGASESLLVPASDPWATPFEAGGLDVSPPYAETVAWLARLAKSAPNVKLTSLGKSHEGRDVWMVIASKEGAANAEALRANGRPTLLAQGGIHPGEIDGKDAGMMLLRDLTVRGTKRDLLEGANLLFVPIFGVDGHERAGCYGRVNQRGPSVCGWRTNARNLNLNRDYAKLDAPEMRAMVRALAAWDPDLYLDIHVTDGADYQYDVTWGSNGRHAHSPSAARWLEETFDPAVTAHLEAQGHVPGPLVFAVDDADMTKGNRQPTFGPRFSHGYGDARHLPTLLVENHSLKPFRQRVLGTYALLEASLRVLGERGRGLRAAVAEDRARRRAAVPLDWKAPESPPRTRTFLGVESRVETSPVTGGPRVVWTGRPVTLEVPFLVESEPAVSVPRPKAYWVPASCPEAIERLRLHGIRMETTAVERTVDVEASRVVEWKLATAPFEGRVPVASASFRRETRRETYPRESVRVPTDQPLGDLAMLLLEPESADSFFRWGFFLEVFQRTEYVEAYILDPTAERMLAADPALKARFEARKAEDPAFAKDPKAQLEWLYLATPFVDERHLLYPVGRER